MYLLESMVDGRHAKVSLSEDPALSRTFLFLNYITAASWHHTEVAEYRILPFRHVT